VTPSRLVLRFQAHPYLCDVRACQSEWEVRYQPGAALCRERGWKDGARLCDEHHRALIREDAARSTWIPPDAEMAQDWQSAS
jgi:hypothetical protein